jgi:hypothetical protein
MDRLARKRADQEAAAINAQISEVLWNAQKGDDIPRIVRLSRVNRGTAYELPGSMFPDGKTRCCVNTHERLNEAGTIAKMDRLDEERRRGR